MINDAKRPRPQATRKRDQGEAQGLKLGTSSSFVSRECILHVCPRTQGPCKCGPRAKTRTEEYWTMPRWHVIGLLRHSCYFPVRAIGAASLRNAKKDVALEGSMKAAINRRLKDSDVQSSDARFLVSTSHLCNARCPGEDEQRDLEVETFHNRRDL